MEDPEVVAAIVAGDPEGIAAAYDRYAVALYAYCRSLLREPQDAADVVQDTFLIATAKLGALRDPGKLRPWLYAVARNECLRRLRSGEATAPLDEAVDTPTAAPGVGDAAEQEELRELIMAAIDGLNRGERDVIELSLRHELDADDLADALGVTRNHAHALLSRARSQLERSLGALVVARTGREACAELDAALAGWDGQMNVLVRKRVSRHIERCKICGERKRRELSPALFVGVLPLATLMPGLRERVLRICADHTLAGQVHRATVIGRAGVFGPNGFPKSVKPPAPPAWHRVLHHSHAVAAGTATAAVVGVGALLIYTVPHHGGGAAAGPGAAGPAAAVSASVSPAAGTRSSPHHHASAAPGQGASAAGHGSRSAPAAAATAQQPATTAGSSTAAATASATESSPSDSAPASPSVVVQGSLLVSLSQLKLVAVTGLPTGTFTLTAQGGPVSSYSISGGGGQLTVSPSSGSIAAGGSVTITVTATSLIAIDTTLTINPGGQTVTVLVTLSL